jgi:septum site-determining protein MinC
MPTTNLVVFKGRKNGITILLDEKCQFDDLKQALGEKALEAQRFFNGAKTAISFQGRPLSEDEQAQLLAIVAENANLDISFVAGNIYNAHVEEDALLTPPPLYLPEHITKFHGSSLRSGQSIRFAGSVVVQGDMNPGSEVIAEGNIIVLGIAKGLLHAGCMGDTNCFVSAVGMIPMQLRIGDIITTIPKEMVKKYKNGTNPCYAYVKDGQIYIAPLSDG